MNWKKTIGLGLLLWVIMFAIASVFVAANWMDAGWASIVLLVITILITLALAGALKPVSAGSAFGSGVVWAVISLVLDYLITRRFDADIFSSWEIWVAYILIILLPMAKVRRVA